MRIDGSGCLRSAFSSRNFLISSCDAFNSELRSFRSCSNTLRCSGQDDRDDTISTIPLGSLTREPELTFSSCPERPRADPVSDPLPLPRTQRSVSGSRHPPHHPILLHPIGLVIVRVKIFTIHVGMHRAGRRSLQVDERSRSGRMTSSRHARSGELHGGLRSRARLRRDWVEGVIAMQRDGGSRARRTRGEHGRRDARNLGRGRRP